MSQGGVAEMWAAITALPEGSSELFFSFLVTTAVLGSASSVQTEHSDCIQKSRTEGCGTFEKSY